MLLIVASAYAWETPSWSQEPWHPVRRYPSEAAPQALGGSDCVLDGISEREDSGDRDDLYSFLWWWVSNQPRLCLHQMKMVGRHHHPPEKGYWNLNMELQNGLHRHNKAKWHAVNFLYNQSGLHAFKSKLIQSGLEPFIPQAIEMIIQDMTD